MTRRPPSSPLFPSPPLSRSASGHDIHTATSARVFGVPEDKVDPGLRSRAKMVNYGLAYGLSAWGLASRLDIAPDEAQDRKSTRLNSSHSQISYAVFCLKKKT